MCYNNSTKEREVNKMANVADALRTYGEIIADEDYETKDGHFVRITTYRMNGEDFVLIMRDGEVITVGEAH
jgi:hypothetical protein